MYQNCCKKCGSISLHTEVKGNNTGLYCDDYLIVMSVIFQHKMMGIVALRVKNGATQKMSNHQLTGAKCQ